MIDRAPHVTVLLDTHALLWYVTDDAALTPAARAAIDTTPEVLVSAASAWEIATKYRLGKLPAAAAIALALPEVMTRSGFAELPVSLADGARAGALEHPHRDPFDRMLAAQALNRGIPMVSADPVLDAFGVTRVW